MKRTHAKLLGILLATSAGLSGCSSSKPKITGWLSDYSRLETDDGDLRFVDDEALRRYHSFILRPVVGHLYEGAEGVTASNLDNVTTYMDGALRASLDDAYPIAFEPGPGVAELRVAITDIERSRPMLSVLPTKLAGLGLGGASMEAEILDSQTGEQIAAVVQTQSGSRLSMAGVTPLGDAKSVVDAWVYRFRRRLDEIHRR